MEIPQAASSGEPKSRTLPLQTSSSVDPQLPSSASQQAGSGKKKSGGFFSIKRKWTENDVAISLLSLSLSLFFPSRSSSDESIRSGF